MRKGNIGGSLDADQLDRKSSATFSEQTQIEQFWHERRRNILVQENNLRTENSDRKVKSKTTMLGLSVIDQKKEESHFASRFQNSKGTVSWLNTGKHQQSLPTLKGAKKVPKLPQKEFGRVQVHAPDHLNKMALSPKSLSRNEQVSQQELLLEQPLLKPNLLTSRHRNDAELGKNFTTLATAHSQPNLASTQAATSSRGLTVLDMMATSSSVVKQKPLNASRANFLRAI